MEETSNGLYLRWRNRGGASGSPVVSFLIGGLDTLLRAARNVGTRISVAGCPRAWRRWKRSTTADSWRDSGNLPHSTRPCSHFDPRSPGSPSQSTISSESQLQSSCQLTEQHRMATSSQRLLQQPMDPNSGTTHSRQTRN